MSDASQDRRPGLRHLRLLVVLAGLATAGFLAYSFATGPATAGDAATGGGPERPLVATVDGTGPGQIVAYGADGDVIYRNRSLWLYHDVDPSPAGDRTVRYVASDGAADRYCGGDSCIRNVVERVNLTTGNVTRLHAWTWSRNGSSQIHDVDRVNESVLLVADIDFPDRVFMVNTTTDAVIWEWRVSQAYAPESGGSYPGDWTHLNDVEYLPDGRVMVSLRNQDQVVFVDPGEGLQRNWTLGADDRHRVLYEQHNPDYIPPSRGGPAVLVADSENNRVVEYRRVDPDTGEATTGPDGEWRRTWVWTDDRLQWPRDADRLPSGHTLVVDSHGSRILSVAPNGTVAWSRPFPDGGYDAELLGTGDESAGPSAARADLTSRRGPWGSPVAMATSVVPPLVLHGLLYALPVWTSAADATALVLFALVATAWLLVEIAVRLSRRTGTR